MSAKGDSSQQFKTKNSSKKDGLTKNDSTIKSNHKVFYGNNSEVNRVGYSDYNDFLDQEDSKQRMEGFDQEYSDIVDYIMKITHRIWEEKGIGIIYDTYHNDVEIHAGSQNITGIKEVIAGTLQTLHAFPDRKLMGENVIWSKYDKKGYFSSHRVMSTATNLGDSKFGSATGRKVNFRTVAECVVHNNRIHKEWLVRDNLWIVKQLGFDPHQVAKKMAEASRDKVPALQSDFGVEETMNGQFFPKRYQAKDSSVGELVLEMCNRIYECRLFNEVKDYYSDNAVVHYICNKDLVGYSQIQGMLISLFASFPNASYSIDRVVCNQKDNPNDWDVSVRWRLRGLHEGRGYFGEPSGKLVEILGVNHYHIIDDKVVEEWVTFDGLDVLRQIYLDGDKGGDSYDKDEGC
ncbi:ester cyclase [Natroniella acetigena]|uniref:ester cyclase n=1 Tax=Natroniella acetigena TaxID=52004 RepID=UPI00200A63E1|nr:ester cyclase [Natroniella acetigena]MCK8827415.1 ester cyclase [Natroniella acetigena]